MKHYLNSILALSLIVSGSALFSSCGKDDPDPTPTSDKEQILTTANAQFVNDVVVPTYRNLADDCLEFQEAIDALKENPTQANVNKACELWKKARKDWELSEAFLHGAAKVYDIDPHIDTWPLVVTDLENLLNNDAMMANIDEVVANLNTGLVGFHGVEYIIFRDGQPRAIDAIPAKELAYASAVAGDLAVSCLRLEASWAGHSKISAAKLAILEEAERDDDYEYGPNMLNAGKAGSTFRSVTDGTLQIFDGIITILDEVGPTKIGRPYYGTTADDINYIESPHSWNSITDFHDNLLSARNVYYGAYSTADDLQPQTGSLSRYVAQIDKQKDDDIKAAFTKALAAVDAMPRPFVKNFKDPKVEEAIKAIAELTEAFTAARLAVRNQ